MVEQSRRARVVAAVFTVLLIVGWLGVSGVGGPYFGKISEVSTNDQSSFLPESAESTRAAELAAEFSDSDALPAILVFDREGGVSDADGEYVASVAQDAEDAGMLAGDASPPIPSEDGEAYELILPLDPETGQDDVETLRAQLEADAPEGLGSYVTGPAGFSADLGEAFAGIDGLLLLVAVIGVFIILLIVYRSPLLPFLVLFTAIAALSASILVVYSLASADIVMVNGQVQGILFILVVGAATDYSLLFVARFRDTLAEERSRLTALVRAWKGTLEPILASAGTVIAGLLCLLISDLSSNKALGPVAATGIAMSVLAAMTFLPALIFAFGRVAFWPLMPRRPEPGQHVHTHALVLGEGEIPSHEDAATRAERKEADAPRLGKHGLVILGKGVWAGVARFVARAPRLVWIVTALALFVPALFVTQLRADGVAQSEIVLGESQARDGQEVLAEHFPGGSGSPVTVLADESALDDVAEAVEEVSGVDSLAASSTDSPSGTVPLGSAAADAPPGAPTGEPTVVDGRVLIQATLAEASDSLAAEAAVAEIRERVHAVDPDALVGGETAVDVDTNATAESDRAIIIPLVLAVITLILMLLLRSILAPLLLLATTVLSFGTALGVSALVFNHLLGFPGADPSVPLFAFVFLVALGIDYNIFLMSRVREESLIHGTRPGVLRALVVTGGVITSAGVVLAATFAALAVIPIMFLVQLAFIVAFGVMVDALIVRSLLVPALALDIGRPIWWPWRRRFPS